MPADANHDLLQSDLGVFAGGGELGARMRAIDWSTTPLGPVHAWPQSLRTCVRIILTSRQPMFVWWGDELINLYNDAYKSIVGGKHPAALGQPARVVWREIWDQIRPRAEAAMRRNEGTYDEALLLIMERNGYREETYYTFSYSPVPNDQGGTGGILCANTEDTQKITGERQLSLLRDLASRASGAHSLEQACERAAASLATNRWDLPFALLYLSAPEGGALSLVATSGIDAGHAAAPKQLDPMSDAPWPVQRALGSEEPVLITDLDRLPGLPSGAWREPPRTGVAVRLSDAGSAGRHGLLIAGLNPFRLFDEHYSGFLRLVAGQIASTVAGVEAYQQERKRAEALAELDRAKTTFFSNVSHEFRTPLTLMLGPTEDALGSGALTGESLRTVYRNELRLLKLVNNLLDFSRIEAKRAQVSYAPTDLALLTRDLTSAFRAALERAGLELVVDCPPLPELVHVDVEMWEKIVLNLISNAFKFTFEGSIRVELRALGKAAVLEVSDTGTGIPEHELPHIFERFHRVQGARSRTYEGSGIGLALVHELVRMHQGTIAVRSVLGQGTTFRIEIPFGSAHVPATLVRHAAIAPAPIRTAAYVEEALRWLPDSAGESEPPQPASSATPSLARILIVDDNADMRGYLRRILASRFQVDVASDGVMALARMRDAAPDLVLTDAMMPELDGFGLLQAIKGDPALSNTPVLMISARAGEEARVEGLQAGADDYLVKPFSARELVARVTTHLKLAKLRANSIRERQRFYSFLSQAPVPIAVFEGPDLVIAYLNDRALRLVGGRAVLGLPLRAALPELVGTPIAEQVARVYRSGEPEEATQQQELALTPAVGSAPGPRYMITFHQPLRNESGDVYGVISGGHDITDLVLAKQALEAKSVEAASANRAKDEFLAMLGHELRNPLAPISTALHLMRLRGADILERERSIIERQVEHMVRLVDDLLEVSRITRGKIVLKRATVELGDVLARALELSSPLIEQRQHHLAVEVTPGLHVEADPSRLAQVFANLLTNAAKYTPSGGRIVVSAARRGEEIVVRVRDTGIGIRPEILPNVFELFVQGTQTIARSDGGLGLGLAIVRSLVSMHGGKVEAQSAGLNQGSEFVVTLKLAAAPVSVAPSRRDFTPHSETRDLSQRQRILVVDDNEDAAESLAEVLLELGHIVEIAHDGAAALARLQSFIPDIAFLDIGLPAMDGYELARRIREQGLVSTRLIALTGYGQAQDRARTHEAGFDHHLVKPVDLDKLYEHLG